MNDHVILNDGFYFWNSFSFPRKDGPDDLDTIGGEKYITDNSEVVLLSSGDISVIVRGKFDEKR